MVWVAAPGCVTAGRDFTRPSIATIKLGTTSRADILRDYGPPYETGQLLKHNQLVSSLHYAFAKKEFGSAMVYKKKIWFFFVNELLVGYSFSTGFPKEQRDFDTRAVQKLVKGTTTKAEVLRMFGEPWAALVYPMIADAFTEGDSMFDFECHAVWERLGAQLHKRLRVFFDPMGLVKDVKLEESQKPPSKYEQPIM